MKYSEFKREIEVMGLNTITRNGCVEVWDENVGMLLYVGTEYDFSLCTDYSDFNELDKEVEKELFYLAIELASTPLEEREDEKRYRLRLPFVKDLRYLNVAKEWSEYLLSTKGETSMYRDIFTESEIAELKQKYNLDSFILEEVKDDE